MINQFMFIYHIDIENTAFVSALEILCDELRKRVKNYAKKVYPPPNGYYEFSVSCRF